MLFFFLLIISVLAVVSCLLWEWWVNPEIMFRSISSAIIGIGIAIIVTLSVGNKVFEYMERRRWAGVRNIIYQDLVNQICDIVASCTMFYKISLRDKWELVKGRFPPSNQTLSAFNDLIQDLNKHNVNGKIPLTYNKGDNHADMAFYEYVEWKLKHIQTVLIPRIIQGRGDQKLIDALAAFESAGNKLRDEVFLNYTCFPQVVSLIDKARILYETIYNNWRK